MINSADNETKMQTIKELIIAQNETIENYLNSNNENELNCKFLIKSKNTEFNHLVIEVSPQLRKLILRLEKLNIQWSRHSVRDFVSITRCIKFLAFGHTKGQCKAPEEICSHCGQNGHTFKQCNTHSNQVLRKLQKIQ